MASHIALLRGVNVGGHQAIAMARLRAFFGELGLGGAQTVLQSGNVVFSAPGKAKAQWEPQLEREALQRLQLTTSFFVRTAAEWRALIAANPFPEAARDDPSHLVVLFLKAPVTTAVLRGLQAAIVGPETVRAVGLQAYITYPDGIGRSRLTPARLDARLGQRGTARNWNTVRKLGALVGA